MKRTLLLFLLTALVTVLCAQTYVRKTNLPCIYVNTEGHKAVSSKDTYIYATMVYVDENDQQTTYDSLQIRGRGNSTWNMRKKPYRIKFHDKEKFLGKGYAKAKSWTLLANAADKTMMRNAITSAMGDFLGVKFNPAAKFVDLVINDVYLGTYQISDQVEVRPHRVDLTEQDYPLTDTSDITGGYLLEVDRSFDGNYFYSSTYRQPVRIHYPDEDEISATQQSWIRNYVSQFEVALVSADYQNALKGYRPFVDSVSLANWYVATEVSANVDGFYSTYFYKEQGDPHFYRGPLWDYDIAYNNDNRTDRGGSNTTRQLMADVDTTDTRQLWDIMPQGTDGYYNLRNVHTNHIANLSGGSSDAFAGILSYTNDSRNGTSKNRLWYFAKGEKLSP